MNSFNRLNTGVESGTGEPVQSTEARGPKSLPSRDALQGKWRRQIGAAKLSWGKLTDDELMKLEGPAEKLTGLIQERYALTRDAAARQVTNFFDQYPS
ncbi:MAG TPA: CsbD family protein [Steroidobacteraceae bacterium]|nr:CsbD family protein [Steroidobacteraceae bacterium]